MSEVPVSSIIGTTLKQSGYGHFLTVLVKEGDKYIIDDSYTGRRLIDEREFNDYYVFKSFVMRRSKN